MQKTNDPKVNAAIGLRKSLIAALKAEAARRGIPYAELCRQYLEWGLAMDGAGNCPVAACTVCEVWQKNKEAQMPPTTRDAYEMAELLQGLTGRDAMGLVRWAARRAHTTKPGPVFRQLEQLTSDFVAGNIPNDLPAPVALSTTPILVYNATSDEENWL